MTFTSAETFGSFGSLILSALTTPPDETFNVPFAPTDVLSAVPPEDTFSVPPVTEVPLSMPPAETFSVPPRPTDAPLSTPPDSTTSTPPLMTLVPEPIICGQERVMTPTR